MKKIIKFISAFALVAGFILSALPVYAGTPVDWGIDLQDAASPSMERMKEFHHLLLYIITGITLFVLALLIWVVIRYNKRANPKPEQFSHNVMIEVLWTVIPVIILIVIAIPSFQLLYYTDRTENPEMTLKITGYQWYWGYEYPDHGGINFQSYMIPDKDIDKSKGQVRLLSTDNPVVLPVDTNIRLWVTAADVLHAFAVPALGVKKDAMPGRLNETWVRITKPGVYFGQCSELCGKDHAYMPIEIHAVSKEEFAKWVTDKGGKMPEVVPPEAPPAVTQ
jgi:cytochrome c oxidase subunit 2